MRFERPRHAEILLRPKSRPRIDRGQFGKAGTMSNRAFGSNATDAESAKALSPPRKGTRARSTLHRHGEMRQRMAQCPPARGPSAARIWSGSSHVPSTGVPSRRQDVRRESRTRPVSPHSCKRTIVRSRERLSAPTVSNPSRCAIIGSDRTPERRSSFWCRCVPQRLNRPEGGMPAAASTLFTDR